MAYIMEALKSHIEEFAPPFTEEKREARIRLVKKQAAVFIKLPIVNSKCSLKNLYFQFLNDLLTESIEEKLNSFQKYLFHLYSFEIEQKCSHEQTLLRE